MRFALWHCKYHGFLILTSSSQGRPIKNAGLYSVLTRGHAAKKHDVLKQLFTIFQPMCLIQIRIIFLFDFCQLIRIQEVVKSAEDAPKCWKLAADLKLGVPHRIPPGKFAAANNEWGRLAVISAKRVEVPYCDFSTNFVAVTPHFSDCSCLTVSLPKKFVVERMEAPYRNLARENFCGQAADLQLEVFRRNLAKKKSTQ